MNVWRISKVIIFGIILSPIVASLTLNGLLFIHDFALHGTRAFNAPHHKSFLEYMARNVFVFAIMIGLFSLIPNMFVLHRAEKEKIQDCSYYCTFGAVIGIIAPFIVFLILASSLSAASLLAMYMLFGAIAGLSAGLFYWALVGRDWGHPKHQIKSRITSIHCR